ncbi:hypothetical protein BC936DRAFT_146697 [Jimgerdemannia flammicorona]|uniref:Uncharacterized protein n=1 Tax=Jimgerdemannia flammicorona TaxID=994334 RepID=A0A433D726_9FUNG|nr:hypothetical protein BC936DRAFT_146697 [Jimgerdemannia flammicorona]
MKPIGSGVNFLAAAVDKNLFNFYFCIEQRPDDKASIGDAASDTPSNTRGISQKEVHKADFSDKEKSSNDSEIILTDSSVSEGEESLAEKNVIFEESLLGNYNGQKTDPEIFLNETDEDSDVEYCEPSFNFSEWENWTLKSGSAVVELLKEAASAKGHWMRPEVWGIVRCGFKIAKPKWCEKEDYAEIQSTTKRRSMTNPPELISKLLRIKSLTDLKQELDHIKLKELIRDPRLLDDNGKYSSEDKISPPLEAFMTFFFKVLSRPSSKSLHHQTPGISSLNQMKISETLI